ncbi:uncharacterized protein Z518_01515 [Rhinocladiella mackenziei CBS 650.93]|uniref:N-acetyltransferase domain-containing protein n=1 Tax=Rhinocladiella mackenziei CBS 650.93 TaxID=1442369 RepID=A0A0D2HID1_9EURO|nr:uncharacterized protein Z518_01515 [Rhinocladiella mackenziei CBS 650.93]KIX10433.1 hypothetical protein Z518_01515 [Rhinocladiella mackenziei CBS 650.93]
MASNLLLRVFTADDLRNEEELLVALLDMVNKTYRSHHEEGIISRFATSDEIWRELGEDGQCAVIQIPERGGLPVAMACAKRWKSHAEEEHPVGETNDWEIGPVASRNDSQYRKKGLADRCLIALYDAARSRSGEKKFVRFWVRLIENRVADYWRKKGFVQVGPRWLIPKGEWHKEKEFVMIHMCKEILRVADDEASANWH